MITAKFGTNERETCLHEPEICRARGGSGFIKWSEREESPFFRLP